MGAETFSFTIDGVEVEASTGQSVIEACDAAGIYVPRLCYHPDLEPSGSRRRVCACKINGRNGAARVTPAAHGMVIENDTPLLTADRRTLIEMLFVEGNHPCPYCVASGDCELQALGAVRPTHRAGQHSLREWQDLAGLFHARFGDRRPGWNTRQFPYFCNHCGNCSGFPLPFETLAATEN